MLLVFLLLLITIVKIAIAKPVADFRGGYSIEPEECIVSWGNFGDVCT